MLPTPPKPESRFVAVCDVLGFRQMLGSSSLCTITDRYARFIAAARHHVRQFSNLFPVSDCGNLVSHSVFSDTLLVWSEALADGDEPVDLGHVSTFFDVCNILIVCGLSFRMPLRVGVAFGLVAIDCQQNFFVGQPIVDAYEIEQQQQWIGGTCDESCILGPHFQRVEFPWRDVINYEVPVANSTRQLHALNWTQFAREEHIAFIQEQANVAQPPAAAHKYQEALTFYNYVQSVTPRTYLDARRELEDRGYTII